MVPGTRKGDVLAELGAECGPFRPWLRAVQPCPDREQSRTLKAQAAGEARAAWGASSTGGAAMRAVVIYESMFGNTRAIAEAIAAGYNQAAT